MRSSSASNDRSLKSFDSRGFIDHDKFDVTNLLIDEACHAVNGMCEQSIIVIAGFRNVGALRLMRGVIEAKAWNAWTRNSIGINISVGIAGCIQHLCC